MKKAAALLFAIAGSMACVEEGEVETSVAHGPVGGGGGTHEGQGRSVLGRDVDGEVGLPGAYLSTGVVGTKGASLADFTIGFGPEPGNGTCLQADLGGPRQCADPIFNGYRFTASNGARYVIISSLTVQTAVAPQPRYTTGYVLHDATTGTPYCANDHLAYPIDGEVTTVGLTRDHGNDRLTWACSEYLPNGQKDPAVVGDGVRAKAISWGFLGGQVFANGLTGEDLQTTATRMGRADYCYNGTPHTIDGTSIGYADFDVGNLVYTQGGTIDPGPTLAPLPIDPGVHYLEAAWTKPAVLGGEDTARPLCLSRLRWQTLPLGDLCASSDRPILDPRLPRAGMPGGAYCEELGTYPAMAAAGAVLVNSSQYTDLGLRIWKHASGDHYTTAIGAYHVLPDAAGTPNQLDVQPATDFVHHQFLGTLLTKPGIEVWAAAYGADAGAFVKLKSCTKPGSGERLTTTAAHLPAGYGPFADCQLEGFVWTVAAPPSGTVQTELGIRAVELWRYKQLFGADYLTTTDSPAPPGYGPGVQLGWIIEPRYL